MIIEVFNQEVQDYMTRRPKTTCCLRLIFSARGGINAGTSLVGRHHLLASCVA